MIVNINTLSILECMDCFRKIKASITNNKYKNINLRCISITDVQNINSTLLIKSKMNDCTYTWVLCSVYLIFFVISIYI